MSAASMSRFTIRAYLRLYIKNRRKIKLMKQRVKISVIEPSEAVSVPWLQKVTDEEN